jgi:hypothetical protein
MLQQIQVLHNTDSDADQYVMIAVSRQTLLYDMTTVPEARNWVEIRKNLVMVVASHIGGYTEALSY